MAPDDLRDLDGVEDAGGQSRLKTVLAKRVRGLEGGADTAGGRADRGDG